MHKLVSTMATGRLCLFVSTVVRREMKQLLELHLSKTFFNVLTLLNIKIIINY